MSRTIGVDLQESFEYRFFILLHIFQVEIYRVKVRNGNDKC